MEVLVAGTPEGIRDSTALTAGTTRSYDLSAWENRYVKIIVDQNCLFAFSSHAHNTAAGPGDLSTGDVDTPGLKVNGFFVPIADDVDLGATGVQRFILPEFPFLLIRPKTANTALIKVKPTQPQQPVNR